MLWRREGERFTEDMVGKEVVKSCLVCEESEAVVRGVAFLSLTPYLHNVEEHGIQTWVLNPASGTRSSSFVTGRLLLPISGGKLELSLISLPPIPLWLQWHLSTLLFHHSQAPSPPQFLCKCRLCLGIHLTSPGPILFAEKPEKSFQNSDLIGPFPRLKLTRDFRLLLGERPNSFLKCYSPGFCQQHSLPVVMEVGSIH